MERDVQPPVPSSATQLRARIRRLRLFLVFWLLIAALYGTMFVLTLVLHGSFDALYLFVTLGTAGGAVLDVIWIRAAKRQLRAVQPIRAVHRGVK